MAVITNVLFKIIGGICLLMFVVRQTSQQIPSNLPVVSSSAYGVTTTTTTSTTPTNRTPLFHIVISSSDKQEEGTNSEAPGGLSLLNLRCIESIFFHHPKAILKIHVNNDNEQNDADTLLLDKNHPYLKPLLNLGYNIQFHYYQPQSILQETIQQLKLLPPNLLKLNETLAYEFISRMPALKNEKYWYANEANLIRICLLLAEGGIYLDTDVILISPILGSSPRLDNAMGRHADGKKFHNAVMKFMEPQNPFLQLVLNNMFTYYDGTKWGNNGPKAFGRTAQQFPQYVCNEMTIYGKQQVQDAGEEECYINPLPNEAVAPVSYKHWNDVCFSTNSPSYPPPTGQNDDDLLKDSLLVHFNNKVTGKQMSQLSKYNNDTLCNYVMNHYCITCPNGIDNINTKIWQQATTTSNNRLQ